jgi:hypothetical protein
VFFACHWSFFGKEGIIIHCPCTSAGARLRAFVCVFYLWTKPRRLLCGGFADKGFSGKCPPPRRGGGGSYGIGSVFSHCFVGLIEFSGMAAFTALFFFLSACGMAGCWQVNFAIRNLGDGIAYVSRGADCALHDVRRKSGRAYYA